MYIHAIDAEVLVGPYVTMLHRKFNIHVVILATVTSKDQLLLLPIMVKRHWSRLTDLTSLLYQVSTKFTLIFPVNKNTSHRTFTKLRRFIVVVFSQAVVVRAFTAFYT